MKSAEYLDGLHRELFKHDAFAAQALKNAIDIAERTDKDSSIALVILHLASVIGEYKRQVAGIVAASEGQ